jgi:argininosuccinate lyase
LTGSPASAHSRATLADARLEGPPADALIAFYEAPHLEREKRQFREYLAVDRAHAVMLAEQGVLSPEHARAILNVLAEIDELGPDRFPVDARRGSFLLQVEDFLFARIGEEIGGRLHTGRSRLDQGPTVRRLYKRGHLLAVFDGLIELQEALAGQAEQHTHTLMPGYTCLQHAHPTVFGHYLLSFVSKLHDDIERLEAAYTRLNLNPLGAAGLSGTSWPIDRARTTQLLGFSGVIDNAKLAREAFYAAEVIAGLSFAMSTMNDLATDLHLWSASEFGFVETSDSFCGTSSIFPQKKNPSALEAVKFAAGEAVTWLSTALATFRAEGTGDVVMREVPIIENAFAVTKGSAALLAGVIATLTVHERRMRQVAEESWATATNLADVIVRERSLSFRQAHSIVARVVRRALDEGVRPSEVTSAMVDAACREMNFSPIHFRDRDIRRALEAGSFVSSRTSRGGTAPKEVSRLLDEARLTIRSARERATQRRKLVENAREELIAACRSLAE